MLKLRSIIKFALLLGFWFLLSGSMDWQHVVVGAVVTALLMLFWRSPERRGAGSVSSPWPTEYWWPWSWRGRF